MIGSGRVVAERHRRVSTHEHGARVLHLRGQPRRVAGHDQQVLGREVVGNMHRLLHVLGHDDAAVGLADDVRSLQPAEKALELLLDAVRELAGVGDEDAPRQRVVLELRGQVGRDEVRPCLGVGHDHDLGRTCDSVDANRAEHLLLGERHVDVAGARDDVDSRNARCPVSERRDGLRPADPVDSIHAGDVRRGEDR